MEEFNWEKVYIQNADLVYRFLLSRCHDRYLAEDLTSEVFLQAYRCRARYSGGCKLSVWLCQIGKHLLYQHYEKLARHENETEEGTDPSAEDAVLSLVNVESLYRRIHRLPEPMREVVYLRVTGELSFADIGAILEKSENWARVNFYRAKLILREEIENEE